MKNCFGKICAVLAPVVLVLLAHKVESAERTTEQIHYPPLTTELELWVPRGTGANTADTTAYRAVHIVMVATVRKQDEGFECVLEWKDKKAGNNPPLIAKIGGFVGFVMWLKGEGVYPLHDSWEQRMVDCASPLVVNLPVSLYTEDDVLLVARDDEDGVIEEINIPAYLPGEEKGGSYNAAPCCRR